MVEIRKESNITQDRRADLFSRTTEETGIPKEAKTVIEKLEIHQHFTINQTGGIGASDYSLRKDFSPSIFIQEAQIVNELKKVMSEMVGALEDELYFEQLKVGFCNVLSKIEERKEKREPYFSDLCIMLTESIKNSSTGTLTQQSLGLLVNAVDCLSRKINQELIKDLRRKFRKAKLDILPKLTMTDPSSIEEKVKSLFS